MLKRSWIIMVVLALFILSAACGPAPEGGNTGTGETGGTGGEAAETEELESPSDALGTPTEDTTTATEAPTLAATEAPTMAATEAPTLAVTEAPTTAATEAPTAATGGAATEAPTAGAGGGEAACASGVTQADLMTAGETIYTNTCATCHGPAGEGVGEFPALANNTELTAEDATEAIMKMLDPTIHPFITQFDSNDLAAIVTFIRGSFGNTAPALCPEDIDAITGGG